MAETKTWLDELCDSAYRNVRPFNFLKCFICLMCLLIPIFYSIWKIRTRQKWRALQILHKMITTNNVIESVRLIEKNPAAINIAMDRSGYTPFLRACKHGNTMLVKYMLTKGADVTKTTARHETCFYLAVYNRIVEKNSTDAACIHALFHAGADINEPNSRGITPLQMAALFGHSSLVKWLVTKGASTQVFPDPYDLARAHGHWTTAAFLKGCKVEAITF